MLGRRAAGLSNAGDPLREGSLRVPLSPPYDLVAAKSTSTGKHLAELGGGGKQPAARGSRRRRERGRLRSQLESRQAGGRNVIIDYPCAPARTGVTFILNLHGTSPQDTGAAKGYMRYYIPMFKYTQSHSFVIASPRAIGTQWERGGGAGKDLPHLLEVAKWVYDNLGSQTTFDIRSMWVTGHSWGAAFGATFVFHQEFTVNGYVHRSGGPTVPTCGNKISLLGTQGETDIAQGLPDQNSIAAGHGCGAAASRTIGGNNVTDWPNCNQGFVHRNYVFVGKGHGFVPTDWPDEAFQNDVAELIRSTRP